MDVSYTRKVCIMYPFSGLVFILFLAFMPMKLWSQTAVPQNCEGNIQSWIARWTISSFTGPYRPYNMVDGDKTNSNNISSPGPWEFNVDFGIVRHLSGIKLYSGIKLNSDPGQYSPRTYQIWVGKDNQPFTLVKTDSLPYIPYIPGGYEQLIDFNGYFEAKYVRIIFTEAYIDATTFNRNEIHLGEINFLQCGVDPIITQKVSPGLAIVPIESCTDAISQDIKGVINTYFPGQTDAVQGSNTIKAYINKARGSNHTLVRGDRVLIMQMQNALINETNSMAYGDGIDNDFLASGWTDVQNTGEYEFGIVESVSGNSIQLTQPLQKSYSANGVFQVVYSPVYDNVTITDTIKAVDWDGYCGGIVSFDARTLHLNNQTIDVSAQGFRKGKMTSSLKRQYFYGTYCSDEDWYYSSKGEGIAGAPSLAYTVNSRRQYSAVDANLNTGGSLGRGAPGNAGGGGMDNNSGGGGGANIGSGGQGGASWGGQITGDMTNYWSTTSPDGGPGMNGMGYYPNGGMGGTGVAKADPFRVWMGGAGGNGFQIENHGTAGGNGGGIILVSARIVQDNGSFKADGESSSNSTNDGAGGGGAGGTIVFGFDVPSVATINYSAKGGNGGGVNFDYPYGPGGGGGGGSIVVSANSAGMDIKGGASGVNSGTSSQWGANKGMDGDVEVSDNLKVLYSYSCDHGDAPRSFGDAAHLLKPDSPSLGSPGDAEATGFYPPPHDRDAKGDDLSGKPDEDGVVLPFDTLSIITKTYKVKVLVNNPLNLNVSVCGWIDFNGNGRFDENEKTSISGPLTGENVLTWTSIPLDIKEGDSYARFRISTGIDTLKPTGVASDGEVEDYTILIHEDPEAKFRGLYVPNAFLPDNTDNLPRTFLPVGKGLKDYTMMIFDLWGNLIWSNSELDKIVGNPLVGWDGKDKHGIPLPTDTYIWRIKAVLLGNKPWKGMKMPNGSYHTEGPLTIIR